MTKSRNKVFELWFRLVYKPLIKNQQLTAALRPGNRVFPNHKGTWVREKINLRILLKPGNDVDGRPGVLDQTNMPAKITELLTKSIGQIKNKNFIGMSPDCQSIELAKYHLGLIYDKIFTDDDIVTIIRWKY